MGYLGRRVQFLLEQLDEGNLRILDSFAKSAVGKQLVQDLSEIHVDDDGVVDISTCSPLVLATAKALFAAEHYETLSESGADGDQSEVFTAQDISAAMREYFNLLEEFFLGATGTEAEEFDFEHYRARVLQDPDREAERARRAFEEYLQKILEFHSTNTSLLYRGSKEIGGLKNVLGGSSRFPQPAFDGVRKFALYSDTLFIPDPLLPWLEVERAEERFKEIELIRNCHQLLLLKPLVDAEISNPAIVVFPSWEKSFEIHDIQAKDGLSQLTLGFFSHYLNASFYDESEILEFINSTGREAFEDAVTNQGLFWPPEASGPIAFSEAASSYRTWLRTWRSDEWMEHIGESTDQSLVFNGILERITPQYHVRDNAASLDAQPLFWLSPHFHYFQLVSQVSNANLTESGLVNASTLSLLSSLLEPETAWLGNVPIEDLARLREQNANEDFRARLRSYTQELNAASIEDVDKVAASVIRGLQSLVEEHDHEARKLAEKYERKHMRTLGASVLTLAVAVYPWLGPWIGGLAVLAPTLKASYDVVNQLKEERTLSRSLTGVLSEARRNVG